MLFDRYSSICNTRKSRKDKFSKLHSKCYKYGRNDVKLAAVTSNTIVRVDFHTEAELE